MSRDPRVDDYINRAQPFAQPLLTQVRERVHAVLPDVAETLKWSMPAFTLGGKILLMTAAFKQHMTLSFWRGQELRGEDAKTGAMGQFGRIQRAQDLPSEEEFAQLLRQAADLSRTAPQPRKPKTAPKPPSDLHPAFAAALATTPDAKATFDAFAPSCRREYAEWVSEAKREETRNKRIATAIEWLSEGKKLHWRYER